MEHLENMVNSFTPKSIVLMPVKHSNNLHPFAYGNNGEIEIMLNVMLVIPARRPISDFKFPSAFGTYMGFRILDF